MKKQALMTYSIWDLKMKGSVTFFLWMRVICLLETGKFEHDMEHKGKSNVYVITTKEAKVEELDYWV